MLSAETFNEVHNVRSIFIDMPYTSKTTTETAVPFLIKVSIADLNIRKGPGTDYDRTQFIPVGVYTIVEVKSGKGSTAGWGRLKSGAGWISLDYTDII